jgi:hypothetical protein
MRLRKETTKRKLTVSSKERKVMACHYALFKFGSVVAVVLLMECHRAYDEIANRITIGDEGIVVESLQNPLVVREIIK